MSPRLTVILQDRNKFISKAFGKARRWGSDVMQYVFSIANYVACCGLMYADIQQKSRAYGRSEGNILLGKAYPAEMSRGGGTQTRTWDSIRALAEQIVAHKTVLFGSRLSDISRTDACWCDHRRPISSNGYRRIEWHTDFQSGYRWHRLCRPSATLDTYKSHSGVDVKWPWELSRCQHLPVLAVASHLGINGKSGDSQRYWSEFRDEITDWIDSNPVGLGVNWACEMDVAIRAVNWLAAFICFNRQSDRQDVWISLFCKSLRQHGAVLYRKVRNAHSIKKGNHYVAELAGLFLLGLFCPGFTEACSWCALARNGLEVEICRQVRGDGTHCEDSTSYHLLVTEMFLYAGMLADSVGQPFSDNYRKTVAQMISVMDVLASSRYVVPQIGDSDDGYFLKPVLMDTSRGRVAHLISRGAKYSNKGILKEPRRTLWDILCMEPIEDASRHAAQGCETVVLHNSGWAVLRRGPIKIIMCLGPANKSTRGAHTHDDVLSFTLFWDGLPIIVDPGTYVYTSDPRARNRFRCARSHNQPQLYGTGEELGQEVFSHISTPEVHWGLTAEIEQNNGAYAEAVHRVGECEYSVSRKVVLTDSVAELKVLDSVGCDGAGSGRIALCLHPDVEHRQADRNRYMLHTRGITLRFESDGGIFTAREGPYSEGYGRKCNTTWLICEIAVDACNVQWSVSAQMST